MYESLGVLLYEMNRLMKRYYTLPTVRLKCILPTVCAAGRVPENARRGIAPRMGLTVLIERTADRMLQTGLVKNIRSGYYKQTRM